MPYYRQSSNSFRYLRARLRPVTRPIVWAPATVLAVLVVFVWDFWVNQRQLPWNLNALQPGQQGLSADDQAFGADIDNLSVLINDFNLLATNPTNQQRGQTGQAIPGSGNPNNRTPAAGFLATNTQPGQLLLGSSLPTVGANAFTGTGLLGTTSATSNSSLLPGSSSRLGLSGITTAQSTTLPVNVLQQALTANQTQNNPTATSGNTPTLANGLRQPLPPTNFPSLPTSPSTQTSYSTGFPTLPTLPGQTTTPANASTGTPNATPVNSYTALTGGAPAAPTAGVPVPSVPAPAVPTTPSNFGQSPFNSNPFGQAGQFGNVPNPQAQQQQLNQSPNAPISPRAPGRYLGGGQINSFSDPLGTSNPGN
jgi:hypothetical protein